MAKVGKVIKIVLETSEGIVHEFGAADVLSIDFHATPIPVTYYQGVLYSQCHPSRQALTGQESEAEEAPTLVELPGYRVELPVRDDVDQ